MDQVNIKKLKELAEVYTRACSYDDIWLASTYLHRLVTWFTVLDEALE